MRRPGTFACLVPARVRGMFAPLLALGLVAAAPARAEPPLTVFAAASLADALREIDALWTASGHPAPRLSLASSGTLARQIEAGAPADVFLSADTKWMDSLAAAHAILPGTRTAVVRNSLVLVEPAAQARPVAIRPGFPLAALLGPHGRLSVGNTNSVPAGIYAAEALHALGVWDAVRDRLAPAADVRAALLQVERGAAPAGIVYRSDAHGDPAVAIVGTFPEGSHTPILYPGAVLARSGDATAARAYLALLRSPAAQAVFRRDDFVTAAP